MSRAGSIVCLRKDSDVASVCVVAGTGLRGMGLTNNRPYMYAGSALPGVVIFDTGIIENSNAGMKVVGFFGNDWSVDHGDFIIK
ncbi:MAG: hypothetical protein GXO83_07365 [Chlorobi bacterium]|nr:hypothetical protein [Chlorobiota bacterium]